MLRCFPAWLLRYFGASFLLCFVTLSLPCFAASLTAIQELDITAYCSGVAQSRLAARSVRCFVNSSSLRFSFLREFVASVLHCFVDLLLRCFVALLLGSFVVASLLGYVLASLLCCSLALPRRLQPSKRLE